MTDKRLKKMCLQRFSYEKETGRLLWNIELKTRPNVKIGNHAGHLCKTSGYRYVTLDHIMYAEHRIIFLIEHGYIPEVVDHINGIRSDNRIENLRSVTQRQNGQNLIRHRDGHLVGASFNTKSKKWNSNISIKGKNLRIGAFDSESLAHEAYMAAYNEYEKMIEYFSEIFTSEYKSGTSFKEIIKTNKRMKKMDKTMRLLNIIYAYKAGMIDHKKYMQLLNALMAELE